MALLPDQGVLFAGDIAFHGYIPSMQDSYPSLWVTAADVLARPELPVVVPGHGPVGTPDDLREMRDCLAHIVAEAQRGFAAGKGPVETLAGLFMGRFRSWGRQADRLPPGVERVYRELRGELG